MRVRPFTHAARIGVLAVVLAAAAACGAEETPTAEGLGDSAGGGTSQEQTQDGGGGPLPPADPCEVFPAEAAAEFIGGTVKTMPSSVMYSRLNVPTHVCNYRLKDTSVPNHSNLDVYIGAEQFTADQLKSEIEEETDPGGGFPATAVEIPGLGDAAFHIDAMNIDNEIWVSAKNRLVAVVFLDENMDEKPATAIEVAKKVVANLP